MDHRSVRHRCEKTLRDVEIPVPFNGGLFGEVVARRRGRPIRLLPKETTVGPCGIWISLPTTDYVFYEKATSPLHRDHIITHELGHLLCDHIATDSIADGVLRELLPNLDPAMVHRVLGRTTYTAVEEQEAEMIATLVLERAGRGGPQPAAVPTGDAVVLDRLMRTLGGQAG